MSLSASDGSLVDSFSNLVSRLSVSSLCYCDVVNELIVTSTDYAFTKFSL
jgi:hypothetical protein